MLSIQQLFAFARVFVATFDKMLFEYDWEVAARLYALGQASQSGERETLKDARCFSVYSESSIIGALLQPTGGGYTQTSPHLLAQKGRFRGAR